MAIAISLPLDLRTARAIERLNQQPGAASLLTIICDISLYQNQNPRTNWRSIWRKIDRQKATEIEAENERNNDY